MAEVHVVPICIPFLLGGNQLTRSQFLLGLCGLSHANPLASPKEFMLMSGSGVVCMECGVDEV
jgi:hypothetical protein